MLLFVSLFYKSDNQQAVIIKALLIACNMGWSSSVDQFSPSLLLFVLVFLLDDVALFGQADSIFKQRVSQLAQATHSCFL